MGWSCRKEVGDTLDKLQAACVRSTGMSNVWNVMGTRYMFELDSREYSDGRATGDVMKFCPAPMENYAVKVGRFTIRANGSLSKRTHGAMIDLDWAAR